MRPEVLLAEVATPVMNLDADPFVPPPIFNPVDDPKLEPIRRLARKFDPVARDARNRSLGKQGEAFVMEVEERALHSAGRKDLIRDLRWVSDLDGDGAGYDILSFDAVSGARKLIEVKTTCGDGDHRRRLRHFAKDSHVLPPVGSLLRCPRFS